MNKSIRQRRSYREYVKIRHCLLSVKLLRPHFQSMCSHRDAPYPLPDFISSSVSSSSSFSSSSPSHYYYVQLHDPLSLSPLKKKKEEEDEEEEEESVASGIRCERAAVMP